MATHNQAPTGQPTAPSENTCCICGTGNTLYDDPCLRCVLTNPKFWDLDAADLAVETLPITFEPHPQTNEAATTA